MKHAILVLPLLALLLTGCPSGTSSTERDLKKNKMDFQNPSPKHFLGIGFELPEMFVADNYSDITFDANQSVSFTTTNNELLFAIERIPRSFIESIQFQNTETKQNDLEAVRDFYIKSRVSNMQNAVYSEPKKVHFSNSKTGWLQHVNQEDYYGDMSFFFATLAYKGKIYVVQLAGSSASMDFLYDDFNDILKTIK